MNNYYNHANIKSPCPNYIDIESLDGSTMPERRSSDDRRISWHPMSTGRSPGSHRWTTGRSPSGHRPKFRSSAKWIGRPPSSRLAVAGRRLVLDFYDPVQGRKNPAMICRCLKTGIGGKLGDHRTILKACDAAIRKKDKDYKDLFIGLQEFVVGYSKAPEQPQSSTRPICHSNAMTRTGCKPATYGIAA